MNKHVIAFVCMFCIFQTSSFAQEDSSGGDDLPNACMGLGSIVLPGGQTIEEFNTKNPVSCNAQCQAQVKKDKEIEDRKKRVKSIKSVGGNQAVDDPIAGRRLIDGPANLRDAPNGKVLGSFPDKMAVLIEGNKDDWFLIRGYWERACETGWTHKKNLQPYRSSP